MAGAHDRGAERRRRSPPLAASPEERERLGRLLDDEHMLAVFRRELPAWAETPLRVTRCRVRPGKTVRSRKSIRGGRFLVVYTVGVEAGECPERELVLLGTVPSGPEAVAGLEERHPGLREHPAIAPFRRLGAHLPDLGASVVFSLLDPALPALAEITGARAAALLAPHLPECRGGARIERVESALKHYKPLHRAVLRVTASFGGPVSVPSPRSLYVKLFADGRGLASHRILTALWSAAQRSHHLRVPEPLGYDRSARMLVMSEAAGERALGGWIKRLENGETLAPSELERVERCLAVVVRALEDLQRSGLRPSERRSFRSELERVRADRELLRDEAGPGTELAATIDRLLERLSRLAPERAELVPAHGGFRHKQTVGDERSLAFIDWDGFCMASPALDAASFLVRLCQDERERPQIARLAERFRAELRAVLPLAGAQLARYEALVSIEQLLRSFRRSARADEGSASVRNLAAAAERMLDCAVASG